MNSQVISSMDILRFITAGNVDDGKSTLIGRLLYDTKNIKDDVLESVSAGDGMNLAYITDGLRSEREQGITIDVAYKYFTTKDRKFIITDAPGHFQYTRNLVTGASNADVMIMLIDAQNGITEQTKRHALAAAFLKVRHVVVAINKMDVFGYSEGVFTTIKNNFEAIREKLKLDDVTFIPMSALCGDNVSLVSDNMRWYNGTTLMQYLNDCQSATTQNKATRYSVQCTIETDEGTGYAGKLLSGQLSVGDVVTICPDGEKVMVSKIIHGYDAVAKATAGENITVFLAGDTTAKRGDIFALQEALPLCANRFSANICWLDAAMPLQVNKKYILRINGAERVCRVVEVVSKTDINSLDQYNDQAAVAVNEFARVCITTNTSIVFDPFHVIPENGRGILIDAETNYTSGAFIVN